MWQGCAECSVDFLAQVDGTGSSHFLVIRRFKGLMMGRKMPKACGLPCMLRSHCIATFNLMFVRAFVSNCHPAKMVGMPLVVFAR